MENTRMGLSVAEQGQPISGGELDQAEHAFRTIAQSSLDREALRVPAQVLETVRPFFTLGWALGVRGGNTGPALVGVPVDESTVRQAFAAVMPDRVADSLALSEALSLAPELAGPVLFQKVRYNGSLHTRHGLYWVSTIHAFADPLGGPPVLRYDLAEQRGHALIVAVRQARRVSVTPLPAFLQR
ncbi:hypothetical protein [Streptomyces sp. NPDC004528]|uniref:hypothetical protein n=1 Tax=Streptomyces sp. NPDC004528 TaxID=3154550 RepID=UPI0033B3C313